MYSTHVNNRRTSGWSHAGWDSDAFQKLVATYAEGHSGSPRT